MTLLCLLAAIAGFLMSYVQLTRRGPISIALIILQLLTFGTLLVLDGEYLRVLGMFGLGGIGGSMAFAAYRRRARQLSGADFGA